MFDLPKVLLDYPAAVPPPGVVAHLTRYSPDQKWFYICIPLFTIVCGTFLIVHLYTKAKIFRRIQVADYFIVVSFILFLVEIALVRILLTWGLGVHQWNVRVGDLMHQLFWLNIIEAVYCPCIFFVKAAIILQYLQVFAPSRSTNKFMWYGGRIVLISLFIFYVVDVPLRLFICVPREKIWNPFYQGGKCADQEALVMASASFNAASDFIILLLPIHSVWKLQIPLKKKILIDIYFATGLFATLSAAMRLSYMVKLEHQKKKDVTYEMTWMGLWGFAEITLGIIIACGLSLPRFFRAHAHTFGILLATISRPFNSFWASTRSSHGRRLSDSSNTLPIPLGVMPEGDDKPSIRKTTEIVQQPSKVRLMPYDTSSTYPGSEFENYSGANAV